MDFLQDVINKQLDNIYEYDKKRNSSSKIRGFLFQDYVSIMYLLKDDVESVRTEYIEDLDVFYNNKNYEIMQIKYYPKSNLNNSLSDIMTDLYSLYLSLKVSRIDSYAKLTLLVHTNIDVTKPELNDMIEYIKAQSSIKKTLDFSIISDPKHWFDENICQLKKEERKKKIMDSFATEDSINDFLGKFEINKIEKSIEDYRKELADKLYDTFSINKTTDESEHKNILLGLAIIFIQNRYIDDKYELKKEDFKSFIEENIVSEHNTINYLVGVADEEYSSIIINNELSDEQSSILYKIYQNTVSWIQKMATDDNELYKLYNTLSPDEYEKVNKFKAATQDEKFIDIVSVKESYILFLDFLWKIIYDICFENKEKTDNILDDSKMLNPETYIDSKVNEYMCFNFPDDNRTEYSIILPSVVPSKFSRKLKNIAGRMIKIESKPQKWFWDNNKIIKGKNYYNYNTANVSEDPTVVDLGDDSFYIECMECIHTEDGGWSSPEKCSKCIFVEECVKEGKQI